MRNYKGFQNAVAVFKQKHCSVMFL